MAAAKAKEMIVRAQLKAQQQMNSSQHQTREAASKLMIHSAKTVGMCFRKAMVANVDTRCLAVVRWYGAAQSAKLALQEQLHTAERAVSHKELANSRQELASSQQELLKEQNQAEVRKDEMHCRVTLLLQALDRPALAAEVGKDWQQMCTTTEVEIRRRMADMAASTDSSSHQVSTMGCPESQLC